MVYVHFNLHVVAVSMMYIVFRVQLISSLFSLCFPSLLKAFERLVMLECVTPVSDSASSRLQKEFQLMRLMLDRQQIMNCIKTYPNCPTDLYYWATSSAIA